MRTCASGVCGVTYPPTGTLLATQIAGDCAVKVCNGAGIVVGQDDLTDAPPGLTDPLVCFLLRESIAA